MMAEDSRRRKPAAAARAWPALCALALFGLSVCSSGSRRPASSHGALTSRAPLLVRQPARAARSSPVAVQLHPRFNGTWPCNEEVLDGLTVRLFPGYAQQLDDNEWLISLRGWVCDSEIRSVRRRLMSGVLQRGVWNAVHGAQGEGDAEEEPAPPARLKRLALLRRRVSVFLTKSHPSVRVPLELTTSEGAQLWSSATNSVGHFSVHAAVPQAQLLCSSGARQLPGGSWLTTVRTTPTADGRVFESAMLCIPPVGVSVISDIDDTIKLTHVHNTRLMLRATFLDEWLAVPGMPELYRDWANQGASFHYVSSSPWQLQQPLEALLVKAGFPPGTFHLKDLHYKGRRLLNLFRSSTALKPTQIEKLLKSFPLRTFVLVGDAGEKDPLIYAQIARRYRSRIVHIYIRNVQNKQIGYAMTAAETRAQLQTQFRGLPDNMWTVFDTPDAIETDSAAWPWLSKATD